MTTQSEIIHFSKKIVQCDECGSKKLCFANVLNKLEKDKFSTFVGNAQTYAKDQHLFRSGETIKNLFILKSGSAKSYLVSESGDEQIIGFHFPGEVLGLYDLTNNCYSSSTVFLEDANVCNISRNSFKALGDNIPQFKHEIISRLNSEITHAHELLLSTHHLTAEQRIAAFILELSEHMGLIGFSKTSFKLSMSRSDIANYLGLASETTSRIVKKLERDALIRVKNKNLDILDFSGLRNRANVCDKCPAVLLNKISSAK